LGRKAGDLADCRKGEGWKVDLARHLRERHLTPYRWIALNLRMGAPSCVQSLVSRRRQQKDSEEWRTLQKHGKLDGGIHSSVSWEVAETETKTTDKMKT
jgi:hypothetical protein